MTAILNLSGTFLGLTRPSSSSPPVISPDFDTTDLTPTFTWSRWGGDPGDGSVLYNFVGTQGGSPVSLTGATNINGITYTVAPTLTEALQYDFTVSATIGGVVQSTSAAVTFIKPAAGDSLGLLGSATMKFSHMRTANDSDLYLQYTALPGAYTTLVIVKLATGTYSVITGMRGQPMPRCLIEHPTDGFVYMGTDDPMNQLWRIDPTAGTGVKIVETASNVRPFRIAAPAPDPASPASEDGLIWFGSVTNAFPSRLDPDNDDFDMLPTLEAGRTYCYYMLIDGTNEATYNVVYVPSGSPWILRVLNPRTEVVDEYYDGGPYTALTLARRNSDGAVLVKRNVNSTVTWVSVIGGVVSDIATPGSTTYTLSERVDYGFGYDGDDASWLYDVNFAPANPSELTPAIIEYKLKTASVWSSIEIEGVTTSNIEPIKVYPFDADTFLIVGSEYVPPYFWTPDTDARSVGGFASASWYAALVDGTDVYLSGYDNRFFRWDTTAAWTLYPGHPTPTTTNPRALTSSGQKHLYLAMRGSESTREVWGVSNTYRFGSGIFLHRYVPNTDTMTIYEISTTSIEVTGMVVSTEGIVVAYKDGSTGRINIYNPSTGALIRGYTTPNADPGLLVKIDEDEVLTIEDFRYSRFNITGAGSTVYANTTTGELCGSHNYSYERWGVLHGTEVRLQVGNVMNSLNVTDGTLTPITGGSSNAKQVSWLGSTAYAWNEAGFEVNP